MKTYIIERIQIYNNEAYLLVSPSDITYTMSLEFLKLMNFKENQTIELDDIELLEDYEKIVKVYQKALYYLSFKDYSEYNLKQKLLTHFDSYLINQAIRLLKRKKIIDDKMYANHKAHYYQERYYGYKAILYKLKEDHVSDLENLEYNYDLDKEKALEYSEYYLKKLKNKPLKMKKVLLENRLLQRGYSLEDKNYVFNFLVFEDDQDNERFLCKQAYNKIMHKYKIKYSGYQFKQKIIQNLSRKGFSYDIIIEIINESEASYDH